MRESIKCAGESEVPTFTNQSSRRVNRGERRNKLNYRRKFSRAEERYKFTYQESPQSVMQNKK